MSGLLSFCFGVGAIVMLLVVIFRPQTFESFRATEKAPHPTRLVLLSNLLLVVVVLLLAAIWLK